MTVKKKDSVFLQIIFCLYPIAFLFSNTVCELFLVAIFLFFIVKNKNSFKLLFNDKIFIILFIFSIYLIINYFINYDNNPSIKRTFAFIRFPLFAISVSYLIFFGKIKIEKFIWCWLIIFLIIYYDLFFQYTNGVNLIGYKSILQGNFFRLGGFMGDELKIAHLINHFSIIILGYLYLIEKQINNKFFSFSILVLFFFTLFAVFVTGERSNFITIFIASLLFITFRYNLIKYIIIMTFFIFVIFLSQYKSQELSNRMIFGLKNEYNLIFNSEEKNFFLKKDNHYFAHYSVANQIFRLNPIFGNGMNNFQKDCYKNSDKYKNQVFEKFANKFRMCASHPHSFYFEIISELGIFGLILLGILFGNFFYICFATFIKNRDNYLLLSGSLILICYFLPIPRGSFFTNWTAMVFWLTFGIVYSQVLVIKHQKNHTN